MQHKKFYGRHHDLVNPYNVAVSRIVSDVFANDEPQVDFQNPGHTLLPTFPSFRPVGMVGNAYYPQTPDYTLYSGVHVCWSEHSDSSFVYGFKRLIYGLGTMTTTTLYRLSALLVLTFLDTTYFCPLPKGKSGGGRGGGAGRGGIMLLVRILSALASPSHVLVCTIAYEPVVWFLPNSWT